MEPSHFGIARDIARRARTVMGCITAVFGIFAAICLVQQVGCTTLVAVHCMIVEWACRVSHSKADAMGHLRKTIPAN